MKQFLHAARKKFILTGIVLVSFFIFPNGFSPFAKVYIDIDSPSFKLIPIAICEFPASGSMGKPLFPGSAVSENIRKDLAMTGLFHVLDPSSFLENKDSAAALTAEKIRFADWSVIGADYLLKGIILPGQADLTVQAFLFDVARGDTLFSKQYHAAPDKLKAIARAIALDIMQTLINDSGDFNTQIAFVLKNGLKSDIYSVNYDGSNVRAMTSHQSILMAPRWSPDGNALAFTSFKRGRPEIYLRNLRNNTEKRIASFEGLNLCGGFSPDGTKLLVTLSKDGNEEIYVLDINTLNLQRLTNNYAIDVSPSWSPDGKKIVFVSNRSGSPQIYTMDANGNNVKRLTYHGSYNSSPSWSPRGDRIAYEGLVINKYQIFSIDEEGNNPIQLTSDGANNESPSWSPSGRQIVYTSRQYSKSKIMIINANGTQPRVVYEHHHKLAMTAWSGRQK